MQVTAVLIAAGNKLLLKIHALVSLFPVLYLPSIPGLPLLLLFVFISLSFILPKTPLTCHFFLTYRARLIFIMSLKSNISLKSLKSKTLLRSLWAKRRIQLEPKICCISGYTSSFNFISYQILFLNGM
uniref:Uncharacterized protein n=1 Tax=Gossypium raimondii TaxID=29730 RepID=A0A0D2QM39_GOSRA|nr:hypothetical protein B456_009G235800 [Gossypium raimondii]